MAHSRPDPPTMSLDNVIAWRYSNYDTPFWARPNTRDGRWNIAGEAPVQYLTLEPNAAWAELIRAEDLHSEQDVAMVRMPIWVAAVNVVLVDYSTFTKADQAGFAPEALIDDDWQRCQEEGRRLRQLGYGGVIAPSAALHDALNVTVFGARILWSWARRPPMASAISATVAAVGSPPEGLVERVRFRGAEHAGYQEYTRIKALERETEHPRLEGDDPPR
jgi:RES domain-containing protein